MRRCLGVAFILVASAGGCNREGARGPAVTELRRSLPPHPHASVLVVTFDALRADALGVYGNPRHTSPNLDAFAAGSLVFDSAYTVAPVTPTSFAAFWSGMLPTRAFRGWRFVADRTLPEYFRDAGYRTAAFINNVQLAPERAFDRGFEVYDWARSEADEDILRRALAWLTLHRHRLTFVWIHFLLPHAPYVYRESARHLYDPAYRGPFEWTTLGSFSPETPADIARVRSLYEGNVFHADQVFGWLLAGLRQRDLLEDRVIVVSADHGEELFDHGQFQHGRLTEEQVRIPLIVRHPDVPAGGRTPVLFSSVDLLPTLLALVGRKPPENLDGRNLLALEQEPNMVIGIAMTSSTERLISLRRGSRKFVLSCLPEEARQLFDLTSDPQELLDLAGIEEGEVRRAERALGLILGGPPCAAVNSAVAGVDPTRGLDSESVKALKALGYL